MVILWIAELRRFRWLALAAAALITSTLLFVDRLADALLQPLSTYRLAGAICAVIGLTLGLYQATSYRRTSQWIALIHRPVAPVCILAALAAAGGGALLIVTVLPVLAMLGAHQAGSGSLPDARHWLLPVAAWLIAMIGYLAGLYLALAPRRYGWLAILPALLPAIAIAWGWHAVILQAAVALALAAMVKTVFKPELDGPPRTGIGIAATALAIAIGAWMVGAVAGDIAFQTVWIATGTDPLNGQAPRGGIVEASRADGQSLIADALASAGGPNVRLWREQAAMSEVYRIDPLSTDWPRRGALTNAGAIRFTDPDRHLEWTFSHDDMRFHGRSIATRQPGGVRGISSTDAPFTQPPLVVDDGRLLTASGMAAFDEASGKINPLLTLPADRVVASAPVLVGDAVALLTSRDLRLYDARVFEDGDGLYPAQATVRLPGPVGSLMRADLIELLDGYLAVFTYGRDINSPDATWQATVRVDDRGHVTRVATRRLTPDYPALSRFVHWWLSPLLDTARESIDAASRGAAPLSRRQSDLAPLAIQVLAIILSLASTVIAILLVRSRRMRAAPAAIWSLATLVVGAPMLVALWLVRPAPHR